MINFDEYLKYSVITFVCIAIFIWIKKPKSIFDVNGKVRQFGIGINKTIFYYPFLLIVIAISCYYIFYSFYLRKSLH